MIVGELGRFWKIGLFLSLSLLVACANGARPNEGGADTTSASAVVLEAQTLLAELGYGPGAADGIEGPQTAEAVRAFQAATGLEADGRVSEALVARLRAEMRARLVLEAQQRLAALGFDPGPVDGKDGVQTRKAVTAFQRTRDLEPKGQVTPGLIEQLAAAGPAVEAESAASRPEPGAEDEAAGATGDKAAQIAALEPETSVLKPGDRVVLSYYGTQSMPDELRIDPDGRLALPEIGQVRAAGLEPKELRDQVTVKLIESYLGKLDVAVRLVAEDTAGAAASGAHRLSPGDRLSVSTASGDASPAELEVDQDGWLLLPGAGKLRAAGIGLAELRDEITVALLERYMGNLKVKVRLAETERQTLPAD